MSKIFEAHRMKVDAASDPAFELKRAGSLVLFPSPKGPQKEDFNRLAQQTLGLRTQGRGTLLFFASSTAGEGSSYVSYNLAVTLALVYGQKVAWVDANFLSPQKTLGGPGRTSLSAMLENPEQVDSVAINNNPFLIPGGKNLMGARGLVAGPNYQNVLDGLAARFDFVILDIPPVLDSPETGLMALGGDGLLLVIEQKYLKWEIVSHGIQALRSKGVQVLGSVINRREFTLPKVIYDRL